MGACFWDGGNRFFPSLYAYAIFSNQTVKMTRWLVDATWASSNTCSTGNQPPCKKSWTMPCCEEVQSSQVEMPLGKRDASLPSNFPTIPTQVSIMGMKEPLDDSSRPLSNCPCKRLQVKTTQLSLKTSKTVRDNNILLLVI